MAGLVPAIHAFVASTKEDVDARHKAGHDGALRHEILIEGHAGTRPRRARRYMIAATTTPFARLR